jgi:hypothetical protein
MSSRPVRRRILLFRFNHCAAAYLALVRTYLASNDKKGLSLDAANKVIFLKLAVEIAFAVVNLCILAFAGAIRASDDY